LELLIFILYYRILDNPLVFDSATTLNGSFLNSNSHLFYFGSARWLSWQTFFQIYNLTGMDMTWQHAFNIVLHMANTALVFQFYEILFGFFLRSDVADKSSFNSRLAALFAAAFFGLNPVAVYGTAYLIQRTIQLVVFFSLISLIAFLKGITGRKPWLYLVSVGCYFAAVYSKEHAVALPGVLFLIAIMSHRRLGIGWRESLKELWWPFCLYALIAIHATFFMSSLFMQVYEPHGQAIVGLAQEKRIPISPDTVYPLSIMEQGYLFFRYLLVWIVPRPSWLSIDIHLPFPKSIFSWPDLPGFMAFLACLVLLPKLIFKGGKAALFGFGIMAAMLLFLTEFFAVRLAEQFVLYRSYLWAVFFPAAFPFVADRLRAAVPSASKFITPASAFYLLLLIPITEGRIETFDTRSAIWEDTISKIHGDETMMVKTYRTYNNYGHALTLDGDMDKAAYYYRKSIQINPYYTKAYSNLGAVYVTQKKYDAAKVEYQKAIKLEPTFTDAVIGLGVVYAEQGQYDEALVYYAQALKLEPTKSDAWYNAGNAWLNLKRFDRAESGYKNALALNPELAEAYFNLGITYQQWGNPQAAAEAFAKAKAIKPGLFQRQPATNGGNRSAEIITR
jgi:tetratricopeptide (TPR) repeat protein